MLIKKLKLKKNFVFSIGSSMPQSVTRQTLFLILTVILTCDFEPGLYITKVS